MPVRAIISGGQAGSDQGGLAAALVLGLPTGGYIPRGFMTEDGPSPWLAQLQLTEIYGSYANRTRQNVKAADASLLFGDDQSPGSRCLLRAARELGKPVFYVRWKSGEALPGQASVNAFLRFLDENEVTVLNVAGNRESKQPGIRDMTRDFLLLALSSEGR